MSEVNSFSELQAVAAEWRSRNFPGIDMANDSLIGMMEELGELAHAYLKQKQNIRTGEDLRAKEEDAIGDILIFMCGYCSGRDISLFEAVNRCWQEVKDRDWLAYPENGRTS